MPTPGDTALYVAVSASSVGFGNTPGHPSTITCCYAWRMSDSESMPCLSPAPRRPPTDSATAGSAKQRATTGSGLTLMGARVYNPSTGQFTSADPVILSMRSISTGGGGRGVLGETARGAQRGGLRGRRGKARHIWVPQLPAGYPAKVFGRHANLKFDPWL